MPGNLNDFLQQFEDEKERMEKEQKKFKKEESPKLKKIKLNLKQDALKDPKPQKPKEIKKELKQDLSEEDRINELFLLSETPEMYKEEWLEKYKNGQRSRKKTQTVRKILEGRFRITDEGMIILSDLNTKGKSVQDLLKNTKWL